MVVRRNSWSARTVISVGTLTLAAVIFAFPVNARPATPYQRCSGSCRMAILLVSFTAVAFIRTIAPPLLRRRSYRRRQDPSQGPARPSHQRIFNAALATKLSAPRNRLELLEPTILRTTNVDRLVALRTSSASAFASPSGAKQTSARELPCHGLGSTRPRCGACVVAHASVRARQRRSSGLIKAGSRISQVKRPAGPSVWACASAQFSEDLSGEFRLKTRRKPCRARDRVQSGGICRGHWGSPVYRCCWLVERRHPPHCRRRPMRRRSFSPMSMPRT